MANAAPRMRRAAVEVREDRARIFESRDEVSTEEQVMGAVADAIGGLSGARAGRSRRGTVRRRLTKASRTLFVFTTLVALSIALLRFSSCMRKLALGRVVPEFGIGVGQQARRRLASADGEKSREEDLVEACKRQSVEEAAAQREVLLDWYVEPQASSHEESGMPEDVALMEAVIDSSQASEEQLEDLRAKVENAESGRAFGKSLGEGVHQFRGVGGVTVEQLTEGVSVSEDSLDLESPVSNSRGEYFAPESNVWSFAGLAGERPGLEIGPVGTRFWETKCREWLQQKVEEEAKRLAMIHLHVKHVHASASDAAQGKEREALVREWFPDAEDRRDTEEYLTAVFGKEVFDAVVSAQFLASPVLKQYAAGVDLVERQILWGCTTAESVEMETADAEEPQVESELMLREAWERRPDSYTWDQGPSDELLLWLGERALKTKVEAEAESAASSSVADSSTPAEAEHALLGDPTPSGSAEEDGALGQGAAAPPRGSSEAGGERSLASRGFELAFSLEEARILEGLLPDAQSLFTEAFGREGGEDLTVQQKAASARVSVLSALGDREFGEALTRRADRRTL
ncbi:hypothetical protein BESB_015860 [Besnoitia besnoiti]|uniref:Transmembrane protein n=1 Tax=Besnoitia besnoiti TaxID=94643 RepID=A0A2A9M142_BESBE|nr:hypothetical protein BESB_015860 [Besnoitia besnoiti]PFH32268.1 hypothetical protein BESB_015860 [Besnoitia besnoiti]